MSIEAMKQALDALERSVATCFDQYAHQQAMSQPDHFINQAITSLQQAIAKLESQEPVAWIAPRYEGGHENLEVVDEREFGAFRVYTHPPQRTEQNFCPRCGKRTNDIHTCTPPQENT